MESLIVNPPLPDGRSSLPVRPGVRRECVAVAVHYLSGPVLGAPSTGPVVYWLQARMHAMRMAGCRTLVLCDGDAPTGMYSDRDPNEQQEAPSLSAMSSEAFAAHSMPLYPLQDAPCWPARLFRMFRAVHDYHDHVSGGHGFGFLGELAATAVEISQMPGLADLLAGEIVGQAAAYIATGVLPVHHHRAGMARVAAAQFHLLHGGDVR